MSSVLRFTSQRKQNFLKTEYSTSYYLFQESEIISACNPSNFTIDSPDLYLANTTTALSTALNTLDGLSGGTSLYSPTVIDMGKTIRIGLVNGENDIIIFRKVKQTGNLQSLGYPINPPPDTGYMVSVNKMSVQFSNHLNPSVSAAGC
jgi:hypothetical protein